MRFIILSIVLLLSFACGKSSIEEIKSQTLPQSSIQPTSTKLENKPNDFWIYTRVFDKVVFGGDFAEKISGFDFLTIKKETISPQNIDEVKSLPALSEDLINDFIEKNKAKRTLGKGFDVYVSHEVLQQKSSLESFYIAQKKKHPKMKGIVGFS